MVTFQSDEQMGNSDSGPFQSDKFSESNLGNIEDVRQMAKTQEGFGAYP